MSKTNQFPRSHPALHSQAILLQSHFTFALGASRLLRRDTHSYRLGRRFCRQRSAQEQENEQNDPECRCLYDMGLDQGWRGRDSMLNRPVGMAMSSLRMFVGMCACLKAVGKTTLSSQCTESLHTIKYTAHVRAHTRRCQKEWGNS